MAIAGLLTTLLGFFIAFFSLGMTSSVWANGHGVDWNCGEPGGHLRADQSRLSKERELEEMTFMKQMHLLLALALLAASLALAQAPAATPPGTPAPSITADDLKNVETPKAEVRVNGDPDGSMTGTAADISIADPKKGSPFQTS